jgi:hypothetical protein
MNRAIAGLCLAILCGTAVAKEYEKTMRFEVFQPCAGTASFCGPMILAQGELDPGAPERLKKILQSMNVYPRVVFDSPGGNLLAGVQMGELIRSWGLNTAIGLGYMKETPDGMHAVALDVGCYSACAYAFMGGVSRYVLDGAHFGVHQFSGAVENQQASTQVTLAFLSQYMKRMGVDRDLLDVASLTSADDVTEIAHQDAVQFNLDNTTPAAADWKLMPLDDGEMAVTVTQQKAGSDSSTFVGFAKLPGDRARIAIVVRALNLVSQRSPALIPNYLPDEASEATLCSGETVCAPLTLADAWSYDPSKNTMVGVYTAPVDAVIKAVIDRAPLRINIGFSEAANDIDPSVELGREGLESALLSLLKQSSSAGSE